MVLEKLPERAFQMQLHSPGQGVHLLQPGYSFLLSGRCVLSIFFFLVIADLVRKHLVIDKAAAADCFSI